MTPTARSMKWLRDRGWIVARVEQRLHMPKSPFPITKDAFGFGDLLAANTELGIALVQVTSTANLNARIRKIVETEEISDNALTWRRSNGLILLHGWAKRGPRGQMKRWTLEERTIIWSDSKGCWL